MSEREERLLRRAADYQFGNGAGAALFPDFDAVTVAHTSSGRPRQVTAVGEPLVTYGTDGRYRLGVAGGRRLKRAFDAPAHRVVVGEESEPFVREGRNAFAKFVREFDDGIRPGDEVLVVDEEDAVLGVGRAELSGEAMGEFDTGMAVKVRHGAGDDDS